MRCNTIVTSTFLLTLISHSQAGFVQLRNQGEGVTIKLDSGLDYAQKQNIQLNIDGTPPGGEVGFSVGIEMMRPNEVSGISLKRYACKLVGKLDSEKESIAFVFVPHATSWLHPCGNHFGMAVVCEKADGTPSSSCEQIGVTDFSVVP